MVLVVGIFVGSGDGCAVMVKVMVPSSSDYVE